MKQPRTALNLSLLLTLCLVVAPVLLVGHTPDQLLRDDPGVLAILLAPLLGMLILALPFAWPWWLAYGKLHWPSHQRPLRFFARAAMVSVAIMVVLMLGRPSSSWGFVHLIAIWFVYPVSLLFRTDEPPPEAKPRGPGVMEAVVNAGPKLLTALLQALGGGRRGKP